MLFPHRHRHKTRQPPDLIKLSQSYTNALSRIAFAIMWDTNPDKEGFSPEDSDKLQQAYNYIHNHRLKSLNQQESVHYSYYWATLKLHCDYLTLENTLQSKHDNQPHPDLEVFKKTYLYLFDDKLLSQAIAELKRPYLSNLTYTIKSICRKALLTANQEYDDIITTFAQKDAIQVIKILQDPHTASS